jgi:hypothetical protein
MEVIIHKMNINKIKRENLSIGEFAWKIGELMLDFLVVRIVC